MANFERYNILHAYRPLDEYVLLELENGAVLLDFNNLNRDAMRISAWEYMKTTYMTDTENKLLVLISGTGEDTSAIIASKTEVITLGARIDIKVIKLHLAEADTWKRYIRMAQEVKHGTTNSHANGEEDIAST